MAWFKPSAGAGFSLPFLRLFAGHMSLVRRSPLAWREKVRCYRSLVGWFWYFRDWLVEDFRAVLYRRWVPWFKRHAPWTRPLWHAIKSLRDRLRRPESATARARRARRAQLEHWELEASYIKVGHTALFGRDINLWRQSGTRRFHAEITNGSADDTVWIELLYAGDTLAGPSATIPSGQRSVNTIQRDYFYFYGDVRACGKAGDRNQISCTLWHGLPGFIGHRQSGVG
jgi:hypothetical protein